MPRCWPLRKTMTAMIASGSMRLAASRILFLVMLLMACASSALYDDTAYVDVGSYKFDSREEVAEFIESRPALKRLDMYASRLPSGAWEYLADRFPGIAFGWTITLVEKHTIRTDATAFATNHNNQSKTHGSEDFAMLRFCRNLMALDLSHNEIIDLSFLKPLTKLRVLLLGDNDITDLEPIAALENLEYLELFKNHIEDVTPLMDLWHLLDVNLAFNNIRDLFPLAKPPNIQRLWIYNSNNYSSKQPLSEAMVAELQEAMYGTQINSTSYSTLGGWREHPRYYVVFNMLHGALKWLPWDADGLVPRYK